MMGDTLRCGQLFCAGYALAFFCDAQIDWPIAAVPTCVGNCGREIVCSASRCRLVRSWQRRRWRLRCPRSSDLVSSWSPCSFGVPVLLKLALGSQRDANQDHGPMNYDRTEIPAAYGKARARAPETRRLWQDLLSVHVDRAEISLVIDLGCGTGRFSELLAALFC